MEYKFIQAVIQAQKGSGTAFSTLYSRTYKGIRAFVSSVLTNATEIDHVVQDTFVEGFNGITKLTSPESFEEILYSTAALKCMKIRGSDSSNELNTYVRDGIEFDADIEFFPQEFVSDEGFHKKVESSLSSCFPQVTMTVLLYYYANLPVPRIAAVFDCSDELVCGVLGTFSEELKKSVEKETEKELSPYEGDSVFVLTVVLHKITGEKEVDLPLYNKIYKKIMRQVSYTNDAAIVEANKTVDTDKVEVLNEVYDTEEEFEEKKDRIRDRLFTLLIIATVLIAIVVIGFVVKTFLTSGNNTVTTASSSDALNSDYFWSSVALEDVSDFTAVNSDIVIYVDSVSGLKGLMNGRGQSVLSAQYYNIFSYKPSFNKFVVGVYEHEGDTAYYEVDTNTYSSISNTPTTDRTASNAYKWDDALGKLMEIAPSGESAVATPSADGDVNKLYVVQNFSGKYGLINGKYNLIIEPKYQAMGKYNNGLIAAKLNNKWGYINLNADVVIPFVYDAPYIRRNVNDGEVIEEQVLSFKNGMTAVRKDDKVGVIDTDNNVVVAFEYDNIILNDGKCFIAYKNGSWGLITVNDVAIPTTQDNGVTTSLPAEEASTLPQSIQYTVATSGEALNIRISALAGSALVGTIPNGSPVSGSADEGGWVYVTYNGKSGWVASRYLVEVTTTTLPTTTQQVVSVVAPTTVPGTTTWRQRTTAAPYTTISTTAIPTTNKPSWTRETTTRGKWPYDTTTTTITEESTAPLTEEVTEPTTEN